jgi:hypothetical protein
MEEHRLQTLFNGFTSACILANERNMMDSSEKFRMRKMQQKSLRKTHKST